MNIFIHSLFFKRDRHKHSVNPRRPNSSCSVDCNIPGRSQTKGLFPICASAQPRLVFPGFFFSAQSRKIKTNLVAPAPTRGESYLLQHFCKRRGQGSPSSSPASLQGEDLRALYAVCTICKLIFLLAAIKIKDLGIYCKRYYQFYGLAFLSYDQGINPAFPARL